MLETIGCNSSSVKFKAYLLDGKCRSEDVYQALFPAEGYTPPYAPDPVIYPEENEVIEVWSSGSKRRFLRMFKYVGDNGNVICYGDGCHPEYRPVDESSWDHFRRLK